MSRNPYQKTAAPPPNRAYTLTVRHGDKLAAITADPAFLPTDDGLPGSVLSLLLHAGAAIDHACGGVGGCATCHVLVHRGGDSAPEPDDSEADLLDLVPGVREISRLACLCVPDGSVDVEVEIPAWNRNEAREA